MTDSFIPIVSHTPPPIDDEVDDDDFGGFTAASRSWGLDEDSHSSFQSAPPPFSDDSIESPIKNTSLQYLHEKGSKDNHFIPVQNAASSDATHSSNGEVITVDDKTCNSTENNLNKSEANDDWTWHSTNQTHDFPSSDVMKPQENGWSHFSEAASSSAGQGFARSPSPPEVEEEHYKSNPTDHNDESKEKQTACQKNEDGNVANQEEISPPEDILQDQSISDNKITGDVKTSFVPTESEIIKENDAKEEVQFEPDIIETETSAFADFQAFGVTDTFKVNIPTDRACDNLEGISDENIHTGSGHLPINLSESLHHETVEANLESNEQPDNTTSMFPADEFEAFASAENFASIAQNQPHLHESGGRSSTAVKQSQYFQSNDTESITNDLKTDHIENVTRQKNDDGLGNSHNRQENDDAMEKEQDEDDDFADFATLEREHELTTNKDDDDFGAWSDSKGDPLSEAAFETKFEAQWGDDQSKETPDSEGHPTTTTENNPRLPQNAPSNISDDFADFHCAQTSTAGDKFASIGDEDSDADFGDGFTGFESASNVPFSQPPQSIPEVPKPYFHSIASRIRCLSSWFPRLDEEQDTEEDEISQVHLHVEENVLPLFQVNSSPAHIPLGGKSRRIKRPTELWDILEDIDNALALQHQWNSSRHNQGLMTSLGIKTQNVLFSGTSAPFYVPTYAASLGLLEPNKELTKPISAAEKITATSPTEKTIPGGDTDAAWTTESDCSIDACSVGSSNNTLAPTSVLDTSSFNLDILETASSYSTPTHSAQDKLDPELLELAMNDVPPAAANTTKLADPLSKILASLGVSKKKEPEEDEEELSEEAAKIVANLPDLSYMRSSVLMFPVGQTLMN
ncbi:unnamed protein product [Clavelina lepadiformis]|uniref:Aftiphilin clathrin-binding box domain-containing protein n=1 Tax=Clavelina lepadiformis TaxID=159417 RepID=A0ABP0GTQ7_CLALP